MENTVQTDCLSKIKHHIFHAPPLLRALCIKAFKKVQLNKLIPGPDYKSAGPSLTPKSFVRRISLAFIYEAWILRSYGFAAHYIRLKLLEDINYCLKDLRSGEEASGKVLSAIIQEMKLFISSKESNPADTKNASEFLEAARFITAE